MKIHTQTELRQQCEVQLHLVGQEVNKKALRIEDIGDYIPGSVMVQDIGAMTNTYMNKFGCDILHYSSEELRQMGSDYFIRFFPADEIKVLKAELYQFVMKGDKDTMHSFFQRVRPHCNTDYTWYFTTSRLYSSDPDETGSLKMSHVAIQANMLSYAGKKLSNLVEEDAYVRKNYHLYNLLTPREKEIIRLIVDGESSIRIADMLFVSIHTINNHRKNILHKLQVNCLSQLIKFAVCFSII